MKDSCPFFDGCSLLRTTEYALWKKIIVYRGFPERVFDCGEAFRADDMLHAAGITDGCLGIDAELNQPAGNQFMTFINHFSNLAAGIGQIDKPFFGYGNMVLFA